MARSLTPAEKLLEVELDRYLLLATAAYHRHAGDPAAAGDVDSALPNAEAAQPSPMAALASRLHLYNDDVAFLWGVVATTVDPRLPPILHSLAGAEARRGLTPSLHAILVGLTDFRAHALCRRLASSPLCSLRLIEAAEDGVTPATMPYRASQRMISYLAGNRLRSAGLTTVDSPIHDDAQRKATHRIADALASAGDVVVIVDGQPGSGRRTAIAHAARSRGLDLLALDASTLEPAAFEPALRELAGDCLLQGAAFLLCNVDDITSRPDGDDCLRSLARVIASVPGSVAITSSTAGIKLPGARPMVRVPWPLPDPACQRNLWRCYLKCDADRLKAAIDQLASRYRLGAGGIRRAVESARAGLGTDTDTLLCETHLNIGVRDNISERLGNLADRVTVTQRWEDLVLDPDTLDQVRALVARVRHAREVYEDWGFRRKMALGIGVSALFCGAPGTGKTMVAGLVARELDLEVYQVDLSQVVSKWVGETEKQLAQIFDAAEAGHALLLFDEADSLFARRTEVKGAVDRYANLEVNYLLQRMERFAGITILTTNLDTSIDPALIRRLSAKVQFDAPDEDQRVTLWQRVLDTGTAPLSDDIDYRALARDFPDMTGANIRNAAIAAAFLAAADKTNITHTQLLRAAAGEYRSMGRMSYAMPITLAKPHS